MPLGPRLDDDVLWLTRGRDFRWAFECVGEDGEPKDFPPGMLFLEVGTTPPQLWRFVVDGSRASVKVESETCDLIPARTRWQLVFLPDGEPAGGDPVARGTVRVQT